MPQSEPIWLIRLYVNSLQHFWASFSRKMNAVRGRSIKDSEREWGARTTGEIWSAHKHNSHARHLRGFHDRRTGTRQGFRLSSGDGEIARCLRARRVVQ